MRRRRTRRPQGQSPSGQRRFLHLETPTTHPAASKMSSSRSSHPFRRSQKRTFPPPLLPDKREIGEKKSVLLKYGTIFCPSLSIFDTLNINTLNNTLNIEWKRREEKSSREKQTCFRFVCANACVERKRTLCRFSFFLLLFSQNTKHDFHRQSRLWCCDRLRRRPLYGIIGACVRGRKKGLSSSSSSSSSFGDFGKQQHFVEEEERWSGF